MSARSVLWTHPGNTDDEFFVSTAVSIKEIKAIVEADIGVEVDRWMVFATSWDYGCGGPLGLKYHLIS